MKNPSNMKHVFSEVPKAEIPRSAFDRTSDYKTMFNSGYLIPFFADEVLPGDTFNVSATMLVRMPSALNVPVMDNMFLDTFYFFCPNRLVWNNWQKFMGEQANPGDSISYTVPVFTAYAPAAESLSDYLGVPPIGAATTTHISLPWRMYNLIYNEWFRDQNLQNSVTVDKGDGPDAIASYVLLKRGKRHDYFTSALPWTQKGTAVTAGLTGNAPVTGVGFSSPYNASIAGPLAVHETPATDTSYDYYFNNTGASNNPVIKASTGTGGAAYPVVYADLSSVGGLSINALRLAFQTQKMLERDARGGTRYTEIIKSHFGVTSPDARLQRPEFLGGRSTPIQVNPVAQTSASNTQPTPAGDLSAFAQGASMNEGFTKSFTEHGWVIGLVMVRADLTYQQGLRREFSRSTRLDYYFPALSHLGEQAILNKEIYLQGSAQPTQDAAAFGYQERYAEYRYKPSMITGKLRSTYATPLDMWHLSQKFTSLPTLSATFIVETPPISRIIAVTTEPEFVLDCYIKCKAVRPMPVYSVPGLIDHF